MKNDGESALWCSVRQALPGDIGGAFSPKCLWRGRFRACRRREGDKLALAPRGVGREEPFQGKRAVRTTVEERRSHGRIGTNNELPRVREADSDRELSALVDGYGIERELDDGGAEEGIADGQHRVADVVGAGAGVDA